MTHTKEKIFSWFLLGFIQNSSSQDKKMSELNNSVHARIKSLRGNAFSLYGTNEYDVAINLLKNLKSELNDLVNTLENHIPLMSTLRTDDKNRQKCIEQLKKISSEDNILMYSIESIDKLLNTVNNLLVTPLILMDTEELLNEECFLFSNSGLTRVTPEMMALFQQCSNKVKSIDISNNNLRYYPKDCFKNLPNLLFVSLQNNKLTRLPKDGFSGSNELRAITLAGNKFGYIHPSNQVVLKKTHNSALLSKNIQDLKQTPLYSLIKNHAAKALSTVTFALTMFITSYLALTSMLVAGFIGLGLSTITYEQANAWVRDINKERNKKGIQPDNINNDAINIGKATGESIASEALSWISPTAYTHYESYCFGLRKQQYGSFKENDNQPSPSHSPKI